jgi:hypothetical protein
VQRSIYFYDNAVTSCQPKACNGKSGNLIICGKEGPRVESFSIQRYRVYGTFGTASIVSNLMIGNNNNKNHCLATMVVVFQSIHTSYTGHTAEAV